MPHPDHVSAARRALAVPVAPVGWAEMLAGAADEYVCLATPEPFVAVGRFYGDFSQTSDREVVRCLRNAAIRSDRAARSRRQAGRPDGSDNAGGDGA